MREKVDWGALLCINLKEAAVMDDTDTSHLQSPDATLPASSLANDLKILLTYSKRAEWGWVALHHVQKRANLKKEWGVAGIYWKSISVFQMVSASKQQGRDFIMLDKNCED